MWALASSIAFLAAVAGHAGLRRIAPSVSPVAGLLLLGGMIGIGLAAILLGQQGLAIESWAGLASYAFACELYIFLFSSASSSISAAFLYRLRSGALPSASGAAMVEHRLGRMVSSGILEKTADGYRHTRRGTRLLRAYRRFRAFFRRGAYGR